MDFKVDNLNYQNRSALPLFLKAISQVIFDRVLDSIKSFPYYGVMIDETKDVQNLQKLIIYIRSWDKMFYKTGLGIISLTSAKNPPHR